MLRSTPQDIHWPSVREGKLEGNMALHVVTDRTGHVREASPYESDNDALRAYGRELVLSINSSHCSSTALPCRWGHR